MYSNQMNGINSMNPMNLNLFNSNAPNAHSNTFLSNTPLSMNSSHNSGGINNSDTSPDNSANNSTSTPTDPSLFMPTIGVIDDASPPITSPNIANSTINQRPAFISNPMPNYNTPINTSFRFDQPRHVSNIQSIHPSQHLMQQMSTGPPTQTVLFNPQFVGTTTSNTSPYQTNNSTPTSYGIHNGFAPNMHQTASFRPYQDQQQQLTQQLTSQIPNALDPNNINNMNNINAPQSMPLLQNENFNVSNLNVNPGFAVNDTSLPPNVMALNPINILNAHHPGPKTLHQRSTSLSSTPVEHGAAKFGIPQETKPIITDINTIERFSFSKPIKRRGRPPKSIKKQTKTKRKKKKNSDNAIEFLQNVEWAKAHSYHQYCPFCVRDERKKQKLEFWKKLPVRETLTKQQRKEYDKQCKQLLQQTEDRVKRSVVFESGTEYRRHYDLFHKKYGFKCIYSGCCKESSSWYNFVAHLTQHDREYGRPFHCAYIGCNRRSSTKHNLIKHLQGVHKWRIINKEEPKQSSRSNVMIQSETESTVSTVFSRGDNNNNNNNNNNSHAHYLQPQPLQRNINNHNHNNNNGNNNGNGWNGNFDLKKDVVQEPIINCNPSSTVMISPPRLLNNNLMSEPSLAYTNPRMNGLDGLNASTTATANHHREPKQEPVSNNNNCIVSPHLITAITDKHSFVDREDHDDSHFSSCHFPLNHTINPLNTKEYDNYDIFTPIFPDRRSPLSLHSRFSL